MRPRLHRTLVLILLMAVITGCWDRREIESRASISAMAIDDHPGGVELSVQIPVPIKIVGSGGGGGGEGGQEAVHNFSAVGKTMYEAWANIQNQTSQELFLGHTRLLLLSEKVAREKGRDILDAMRRHSEIRRRLWPLIVSGKAKEALRLNVKLAQIPSDYLLEYVENGSSQGRMAEITLGDWFVLLSDPTREPFVNYVQIQPGTSAGSGQQGQGEKPGEVKWKGIAVMKGDRMVGILSREESNPLLQIGGQKAGYVIRASCPGEKGKIVFLPRKADPHVSVGSPDGERVNVRVTVDVEGEIVENTCSLDLSKTEAAEKVAGWVRQAYEAQARKTFHRVQKEFRSDVFRFGSYIHAFYPGLWKRIDWERDFPNADIDVRYRVTVRDMGLEAR
jgi:spore germination protein KC